MRDKLVSIVTGMCVLAILVMLVAEFAPEPADADVYGEDIIHRDSDGDVIDLSYYGCEGDSVSFNMSNSVITWQGMDPTGTPGWLNIEFKQTTGSLVAWVQFKEVTPAYSLTYAWGDAFPVFLFGEARAATIEVRGWSEARVRVTGASDGAIIAAWYAEVF